MSGHDASSIARRLVTSEHRSSEADIQATVRDLLLHGGRELRDAQVRMKARPTTGGASTSARLCARSSAISHEGSTRLAAG